MRDKLIAELAAWIEPTIIAEAIVERMELVIADPDLSDKLITLENAKNIWLDFLECELSDGLETRCDSLVEERMELKLKEG